MDRRSIVLVSALALASCGDVSPSTQQLTDKHAGPESSPRFDVVREGVFRDSLSYDYHRGIYIITDKKTGVEYLGVSGIGISELGSHGKGGTDER